MQLEFSNPIFVPVSIHNGNGNHQCFCLVKALLVKLTEHYTHALANHHLLVLLIIVCSSVLAPCLLQGPLCDAFSFTVLVSVFLHTEPEAAMACAVSAIGSFAMIAQVCK